jgi:cell division septum initiation protein DivIVA
MILQRESVQSGTKQDDIKKYVANAQREAQLAVDEAKIKADRMLTDVQQTLNEMINRKEQVERRLKEFIQTERELIKAYEKEDEE